MLLRMAADQERADRIRALKLERPDLTWRRIADYVGVTERSATDWQKKGGIEYDNAKKLAELFEVDVDFVWRGAPSTTPDLSSPAQDDDSVMRRVEDLLKQQNDLLQRQSDILDRIEKNLASEQQARSEAEAATRALLAAVDVANRALLAEPQQTAAEPEPPTT